MPPVGFEPKISAGERPQAARLLRSWVVGRLVCGSFQAHNVPEKVHRPHVQQPSTYKKPEAASAVLGS